MNKEKYEVTELKKYYKYIYVCTKCGIEYGHDSIPLNKLCPFCEISKRKVNKNKEEDENFKKENDYLTIKES